MTDRPESAAGAAVIFLAISAIAFIGLIGLLLWSHLLP